MNFRKAFHLKESSLTLFPFGNVVNLVYFLLSRTFCKQNDVISQSYKLVDNSKMKQSIKKILMTFLIVQQCYSSALIKIVRFRSPLKTRHLPMIDNKRVTSILWMQMKHVKRYIQRKFGADIDWKPMKEILHDLLKGTRENQAMHVSHICCIWYS